MPLTQSSSQDAWKSNFKAELAANRPKAQALAIAYDVQRRNRDAGGAIERALRIAHLPQRAFGGGAGYEPRPGERGRSNSPYGFSMGTGGGRTDKNNVSVDPGSYVLPADVIAGLGAGNSLNGAAVWNEYLKSMPWGVTPPQISGKRGPPAPPSGNPDTGRRTERSTLPTQERAYQPALGTGLADGGDPQDDAPPAALNMFDPGMVNEPEMFGDPALFGHNGGPPLEDEAAEPVPIQAADGEVILSPEDTLRFANFYAPDKLQQKGDRESMLDYAHRLLDEFVVVQRGRNIAHQEKLQGPVGSKHEKVGHVRPPE